MSCCGQAAPVDSIGAAERQNNDPALALVELLQDSPTMVIGRPSHTPYVTGKKGQRFRVKRVDLEYLVEIGIVKEVQPRG